MMIVKWSFQTHCTDTETLNKIKVKSTSSNLCAQKTAKVECEENVSNTRKIPFVYSHSW